MSNIRLKEFTLKQDESTNASGCDIVALIVLLCVISEGFIPRSSPLVTACCSALNCGYEGPAISDDDPMVVKFDKQAGNICWNRTKQTYI